MSVSECSKNSESLPHDGRYEYGPDAVNIRAASRWGRVQRLLECVDCFGLFGGVARGGLASAAAVQDQDRGVDRREYVWQL